MLEPAIQDKARWWTREDVILLTLLGVLFLLPGLGQVPLFDRDEPRFATAARTMMESGDYLVPRFNGALRPDKPPFVYWLMNLGYALTGGWGELGARLPSAVCGIGTLIVVYFMAGARFGRLTAIVAAMMLGSCALFLFESRMATADGTMLLCIVTCMACAWQAWDADGPDGGPGGRDGAAAHLPRADYLLDRSGDTAPIVLDHLPPAAPRKMTVWLAALFWVALAAGTLTKGVPLVFVFVPMIALSIATGQLPGQLRRWRSHFHLTAARVGIALGIAAAVTAYLIGVTSARVLPETRLWASVLGVLLIGMVLTPGLPGVLARCVAGGNWRWWRQLRPLLGVPALALLVGWWFVVAGQRTDWVLIKDMVGVHFLNRTVGPLLSSLGVTITASANPRAADPMGAYAKPPGFYLSVVWGTFWPWSVLLVPAAYHVWRRVWRKTAIAIDPRPYQFLLAWVLPMWVLLELARGKLLHYPLPLYVALAIACADTLVQSWHRLTDVLAAKWFEAARWGMTLIWVGMGIAVVVAARINLDQEWLWRCLPFAAALIGTGLASGLTWGRPSWPFVLVLAWGGALLVSSSVILPDLPMLQVSRIVGGKMRTVKAEMPETHLAARGYEEPTLVFYAGSNVTMYTSLNALLAAVPFASSAAPSPSTDRYVIAVDDRTLSELDARRVKYYLFYTLPRVVGRSTGNFKPVAVTLISNLPPAAATQGVETQTQETATTRATQPAQTGPATTTATPPSPPDSAPAH